MHDFLPKKINTGSYNPNKNLPGKFFPPAPNLVQPMKPVTPQLFSDCDPTTALTWNDYKGGVPAGVNWGAMTASGIRVVSPYGGNIFQAFFESSQSWVLPRYKTPAANSLNGCQATITAMENYVQSHLGESAKYNRPAQVNCAASILPNEVSVRTVQECTTIFGVECRRSQVAESKRLLKHEKLHFDITCVLVRKANELLSKGIDFTVVYTGLISLYNKLNLNNGSGEGDYDAETKHGCDQSKQDLWQTMVDNGLPRHKIGTVGDFLVPANVKNAG